MAPAHDDDVGAASGGRRRNRRRRSLSWGTLLCFGSQEPLAEETPTTPWERERSRSRRRKTRTVPVDGDQLLLLGTAAAAADSEVMRRGNGADEEEFPKQKGLGCCFLAPARAPGRKHSTMDGSSGRSKQRHLKRTESPPAPTWRRSQSDKNSTSEAFSPRSQSQIHATGGNNGNGNRNGNRRQGAEQPRGGAPAETTARAPTTPIKTGAGGGVGAFGPVVGLSLVVAVTMAGLLGGRLWAVACVCAWLTALSRLRRREAAAATAAGVDSTDHKKL